MDARNELREEIDALKASVLTATARLEAISDEFQDRMRDLDTLRDDLDTLQQAVEPLKHESRAAKRPPGQEQIIFNERRVRRSGSAR